MSVPVFCPAGDSEAVRSAAWYLSRWGYGVSDSVTPAVTHILLPLPSTGQDGKLLYEIPHSDQGLPVLIGGSLSRYPGSVDLLQDPFFLESNAAITAEAALQILAAQLRRSILGSRIAVCGWGRIGKQLAFRLKALGADVTVSARKEKDLAQAEQLGFRACSSLLSRLPHFHALISTVPAPLYGSKELSLCRPDCVKIDLASVQSLSGPDILWERGLPGRYAPESVGALMAQTVVRLLNQQKEART